jgi:ADP-ribose pyrophosphatase YjhB (NUDIX family)
MTEPAMTEPAWLAWAREVQAIAQSGLTFAENPYDIERYQALRALAARVMATAGGADLSHVQNLFAGQVGYATPKVDVRGAAFDASGRILMVREASDGGRWTLPGGWADVNLTAAENVAKEMFEESGFRVLVRKLAAVWDRTRQGHDAAPFSAFKMFFLCEIVGGAAKTSLETTEVGFFAEDALPPDLSTGRVLRGQLHRMFAHARAPGLPTEFE